MAADSLRHAVHTHSVTAALILTVGFALFGYAVGGVAGSGAIAGGAVAFVFLYFGGINVFGLLLLVFALTWIATRIGYAHKRRLGLAESRPGRNAWQVLANLSAAVVCIVTASAFTSWPLGSHAALVGCVAALAEAAADTVSSECGEAWSATATLVTDFRAMPAGTDGAVSVPGTLAGATAAVLVAGLAEALAMVSPPEALIAAAAGFGGSLIDSMLGATLERRRWLNNHGVNFISTAGAAGIAAFIVYVRR